MQIRAIPYTRDMPQWLRWGGIAGTVVGAIQLLPGLFSALPNLNLVGVLLLAPSALLWWIAARQLRSHGIEITDAGILDPLFGPEMIPWQDVNALQVGYLSIVATHRKGRTFFAWDVADSDTRRAGKQWLRELAARMKTQS